MTVTHDDIITWKIGGQTMTQVIVPMAKKASIGGRSNIRTDEERQGTLPEDQLIGQIGQYVGSVWLFGDDTAYRKARWTANQNPTIGDGGSDLIGSNLDFKASLVRTSRKDLLDYKLAVRPRERHQGWVYVLVLVTQLQTNQPVVAKGMGWARDAMLPNEVETQGVFKGAFTILARDLHPLPPFRWLWRNP